MKPKLLLLLITFLIVSVSLIAQNNSVLRNIDTGHLKQLIREHKNIHFVHTNDPRNAIQYYETSPQEALPQQSLQVNNITSLQSNFHLVKDINTQTDANPINQHSYGINNIPYSILNGSMYFSAYDGTHGIQLWRTDGTTANTQMVSNIQPGSDPISEIKIGQNKIYFATKNAETNNYQLYVSNGTIAGTFSLKKLFNGGIGGSYYITPVNNTVYFFVENSNFNVELWKTDGTVAKTVMVKDFTNIGQLPALPASVNGLFYFTLFTNENGRELWRSDGTDAGTLMVKDITPGTDFSNGPFQLTAFKNKLYFSDDDGTGRKLWLTDGTEQGTVLANGNNDVNLPDDNLLNTFNIPFTIIGDNFYTKAFTASTGLELYKYNFTEGFKLIKDITPGSDGGDVSDIIRFNKGIAFVYTDSLNKTFKLYISNGNVGNASLIYSYGNYAINFNNLAAADSILYFTFNTNDYGTELWKTNGTINNSTMVKDIYSGVVSSNPINLTFFNNKLYFNASSKDAGTELWQTKGTEETTSIVTEINTTSTSKSTAEYYTYQTINTYKAYVPGAAINNELFFSATKPETGYELYKSDGKKAGTSLAKDIVKGETGSYPAEFKSKNGNVYFISRNDSFRIYKIDSLGKPVLFTYNNNFIDAFDVAKNGIVYYLPFNSQTNKTELWRSDGTQSGTFILAAFEFAGDEITTIGNIAYFIANNEQTGNELWKSDGTVAGTKMIKDIYPGANGSYPFSLHVFNGDIYFGANDGTGQALWKSNGTNAGTIKLAAIRPFFSIGPYDFFCVLKNRLYLNAYTAGNGAELWNTDGTPEGTKLVKDIVPGLEGSNPSFLTDVNGTMFFGTDNHDLYKCDGTSVGTVPVKNISVQDYYLFDDRCVADGKLFFNAGHVLWVSDGTDAGTHPVNDAGLQNVSDVKAMVAAGNTVFFDGYTNKYGSELYAGDATQVITNNLENLKAKKLPQASFTASVLQNPVRSLLNLSIYSLKNQTLHITISNERGNAIVQQNLFVNKGTNNINLPASNWQTGVYLIKLSGRAGDMTSITVLKSH